MKISTTSYIKGETLGVVHGDSVTGSNVVNLWRGIWRGLLGGESKSLNSIIEDGRKRAEAELISSAERLGANEIISATYRYESLDMGYPVILITVSGTAVKV